MQELQDDPTFLFRAHGLVGAATVTAHWMSLSDDPVTKSMGAKLTEAVGWFFIGGEEDKWEKPPTMPPKPKQ